MRREQENGYLLIALYSQLLIIYVNGIEMVITVLVESFVFQFV